MRVTKQGAIKLIRAVIFLALAGLIFVRLTYLFRNVGWKDRRAILSFYGEEEDSLDVVYIGSSAVYRFWNPIEAWDRYGYTSYAYSTASMNGKTYLAAVKDILQYQDPEVILVEARGFLDDHMEAEVTAADRRVFDSMDFSLARWQSIYDYQQATGITWKEALTEYLDLIYYHSNYYALWSRLHWKLSDNRLADPDNDLKRFKRYVLVRKTVPVPDPSGNLTEEKIPLSPMAETCYRQLLTYCQEQGITLVMVASPWVLSTEDSMQYNTMEEIAAQYDVLFINGNEHYAEMGIDFNTDFYNLKHVNNNGAIKYTNYLSQYLTQNYALPDKRKDQSYGSWAAASQRYHAVLALSGEGAEKETETEGDDE